jgi:hypothetical protein
MAIDRIPGVGPQNTDIATAVAAAVPTIAAITSSITTNAASAGVTMAAITSSITTNAASAGLTNASITSAGNAAGWGATGPTTTQIAAAVPTLAQINTAITTQAAPASVTMAAITSSITTNAASAGVTLAAIGTQVANNAPSPNAWTVISSISPNGSLSTFTFSSLSGYKSYRIIYSGGMVNAGASLGIRINGDATGLYAYSYFGLSSGSSLTGSNATGQTQVLLGGNFNTAFAYVDITIYNATLAVHKTLEGWSHGQIGVQAQYPLIKGNWRNTAAITSISVVSGDTVASGGLVTLLGAN